MSMTNFERVGKALDLLKTGLAPYVQRELEAEYGTEWIEVASQSLPRGSDASEAGKPHLDAYALLLIVWDNWHEVFKRTLGHAERSLVSELREVRNSWAHQEAFSTDDTYRALDSSARLLTAISAQEASELRRMKQELLRVRFQEQARRQVRRAAIAPTEGDPTAGLKPWREVITPHPDVASGRYQQAEFAADLGQVHKGEGSSEYADPRDFYERTFLTEGLRDLLTTALRRLSGEGGDPVVELQTNFGGGKTHSMLALYHLFSGIEPSELLDIDTVLKAAGISSVPKAQRVVLVGTALSPGQPSAKDDGTVVRTLWGQLAWQLGGAESFSLVAEADERGISPGSEVLRELFVRHSPCLILIDEWVRYVGQTYTVSDLPGGSFDANISFAQALTEAARQAPRTLVVASIPASDIEMGGEGGREALARLKNTFSRMETSWRPASAEEGFEIVRRRLFQPLADDQSYRHRDAVAKAFGELYRQQAQEFPLQCRERHYERRLQSAYPIHPELFDRFYGVWSSLDRFQRTRGVLRLMASVIHELWERNDSSLLIMPATIPMDAPPVQRELTRYLEDQWIPVIETDVDGPQSLPLRLDRDNPNLGRYSACRRVARSIYTGSAPSHGSQNPGIDERSVKLACVQPGETVATFGDALRRLTDRATYLYVDGNRYWFSTQPSVTRLAQDRAVQQAADDVWDEVLRRLRGDKRRGSFAGVHVAPKTSGDVPDDDSVRLVIIDPRKPHARGQEDSPARKTANDILENRGPSPRINRNTVVFLAADRARRSDLEQAVRQFLAWDSIVNDHQPLNLNAFQANQAETKRAETDDIINARVRETFVWLLVPAQPDPKGEPVWEETRLHGGNALAVRASTRMQHDEHLITEFSGTRLRLELDRFLWSERDHLRLQKLWEYLTQYLYLPRLRDSGVLREAVQDGASQLTLEDTFAYADAWDEERGRYLGLKTGEVTSVVIDSCSVVVKPEVAQRQLEEDRRRRERVVPEPGVRPQPGPEPGQMPGQGEGGTVEPEIKKRRFHGSVQLDPVRLNRNFGTIAQEVIQHLTSMVDANVEITLEIQARFDDGAPDDVVRVVMENCRTLGFRAFDFEEE